MIVIRREAEDSTGISFAEEVINRPSHTSSISTSFIDFTLPVRCCLGMSKFPTALQSAAPSCFRISFSVSLEFSFQPTGFFFYLRQSSSYHGRLGRSRRVTVLEGAISSKRSVMIALYCSVR